MAKQFFARSRAAQEFSRRHMEERGRYALAAAQYYKDGVLVVQPGEFALCRATSMLEGTEDEEQWMLLTVHSSFGQLEWIRVTEDVLASVEFTSRKEAVSYVESLPAGKFLLTKSVFHDGSGRWKLSRTEKPRYFFDGETHYVSSHDTLTEALQAMGYAPDAIPQPLVDLGIQTADVGSVWNDGSLLVWTDPCTYDQARTIRARCPTVYAFSEKSTSDQYDKHFVKPSGTQFFVRVDEEKFAQAQWRIACDGGKSPELANR